MVGTSSQSFIGDRMPSRLLNNYRLRIFWISCGTYRVYEDEISTDSTGFHFGFTLATIDSWLLGLSDRITVRPID